MKLPKLLTNPFFFRRSPPKTANPSATPPPSSRFLLNPQGWATSSTLYSPNDLEKYNPDTLIQRKGSHIYKRMMLDEQCKHVVKFRMYATLARRGYFEYPEDSPLPETEQNRRIRFFNTMLEQVSGSYQHKLRYILQCQWQGFSITEKIYDFFEFEGQTYIGLKDLKPKPFDSFTFHTDEYGNLVSVKQEKDAKEQEIDLRKFVYHVQNPDQDEHYGQSELREAYRAWWSKDNAIKFWNMYLERFAGGVVTMSPKDGATLQPNSQEYRDLQSILESWGNAMGMVLPSGIEQEITFPAANETYQKHLTYQDLSIAKSLLMPNMLGVHQMDDHGAYAQAFSQLEAFLWTLDTESDDLNQVQQEQIFNPLARLNFEDGLAPVHKLYPLSEKKRQEIATLWGDLVQKGAAQHTDTDEQHLRDLLAFPEPGTPILPPAPPAPEGGPNPPPENTPPDQREPHGSDSSGPEDPVPQSIRGNELVRAYASARARPTYPVIDKKTTDLTNRLAFDIQNLIGDSLLLEYTPKVLSKLKADIKKASLASLSSFWELGATHANSELSSLSSFSTTHLFERLGTRAPEYLAQRAFQMSGDISEEFNSIVQNQLALQLKHGWTDSQLLARIANELTRTGLLDQENNARITARLIEEVQDTLATTGTTPYRLLTIARTAGFDAFNESRYNYFTDPDLQGFVVALEYSAVLDQRTTALCRELDDRIFPLDSTEWESYRPPNHFSCRSILIPVTQLDIDEVSPRDPLTPQRSKPPKLKPAPGFGG